MPCTIDSLFLGFSDYVSKYIVSTIPHLKRIHIEFVYLAYDLIDKDLDFDEEYYSRMIANIKTYVVHDVKNRISTGEFESARITCVKQVMSNDAFIEIVTKVDRFGMVVTKSYLRG